MKTIKYIGTAPLPEEPITGSKRVWDYGQIQVVSDAVGVQLLTTGLFQDDAGEYVTAKTNPLTGVITFSAGGVSTTVDNRNPYPAFRTSRPLVSSVVPASSGGMTFRALGGGATASAVLDSSVLFNGRQSVKTNITTASSSLNYIDLEIAGATVTLDATGQAMLTHTLAVPIKTSGENVPTDVVVYVSDAAFTNYYTFNLVKKAVTPDGFFIFSNVNPAPSGTIGAPNLAAGVRIRVRVLMQAAIVNTGSVWLGEGYCLPDPEIKSVVLTVDDGYAEWKWLAAECKKRNLPCSFGIASDLIGTSGFLTASEMRGIRELDPNLFELTNHCKINDAYSSIGLTAYLAALETCRAFLISNGETYANASLHQFVQGSYDQSLIDAMKASGFRAGRIASGTGQGSKNAYIAYEGATNPELYLIPATASLEPAQTVANVKTSIASAHAASGTAFIMGHKFQATTGPYQWIAGYDANNGMLDLLDWLVTQRDTQGWQILKWSDWYIKVQSGKSDFVL